MDSLPAIFIAVKCQIYNSRPCWCRTGLGKNNQPYLGPSTRWVEEDKSYEISSVPQMEALPKAGLRLGEYR